MEKQLQFHRVYPSQTQVFAYFFISKILKVSDIDIYYIGPYEFEIKSQSDEYTMMSHTRLEGEIKIVKKSGEALQSEDVSIVNVFPNSIFKSLEV